MKYIIISIFIFIFSAVQPAKINAEARNGNSSRSDETHQSENNSRNTNEHEDENNRSNHDSGQDKNDKSSTEVVTEKTPSPVPTTTAPALKKGDANKDGKVDIVDFTDFWLVNYLKMLKGYVFGDFDDSGKVDGVDYVIWVKNFGK